MTDKKIVYLATPYSHPDLDIRLARFHTVNRVAADLMRKGLVIFSPISHTHPIASDGDIVGDWEYWRAYDMAFLEVASKLIVLRQLGWEESVGVTAEIAIAKELGIPVEYMFP